MIETWFGSSKSLPYEGIFRSPWPIFCCPPLRWKSKVALASNKIRPYKGIMNHHPLIRPYLRPHWGVGGGGVVPLDFMASSWIPIKKSQPHRHRRTDPTSPCYADHADHRHREHREWDDPIGSHPSAWLQRNWGMVGWGAKRRKITKNDICLRSWEPKGTTPMPPPPKK